MGFWSMARPRANRVEPSPISSPAVGAMRPKQPRRSNRLRELLAANEPSVGTHTLISWPGVVELIGHTGVIDYVEFVGEYAPYDLYALENFGRAVELFDHMSAMMKIEQDPRTYLAIRAIGSGIQNVLYADIRSAEEAADCVANVRAETPSNGGRHGAGARRDAGYGYAGGEGWIQALEESVVALMIEKAGAIKDLENILAVKGVDMVQFGPADYAMSIDMPGQFYHERCREAEEYMIKTSLSMGKHPRAEISTPDQAKYYLDQGVRHFSIGTDVQILHDWWKQNAEDVRDAIAGH